MKFSIKYSGTLIKKACIKSRGEHTLTDDIVFWTKRIHHCLVPVTSEPLDNDLHKDSKIHREHTIHNIPLFYLTRLYCILQLDELGETLHKRTH